MVGRRLFAAVAVILALALLLGTASAQDYIVRDDSGRRVGTVERGIGDRLVQRDASGRRTGTIEPGIRAKRRAVVIDVETTGLSTENDHVKDAKTRLHQT